MKASISLMLMILSIIAQSQTVLTKGEIFDFSVDDEFHSYNDYPQGGPPNAIRMSVIGKHFSASNDTVFYTRFFDNYYTVLNPNPTPHLDYYFDTYIDTVFYTNLNDSVLCDASDTTCLSIIDTTICGISANGWEILGYEQYWSKVYGKGLGMVRDVFVENGSPTQSFDYKIFYFKKDTIECGTPDITTSTSFNIAQSGFATIFPNPFSDQFNIQFVNDVRSYEIEIYNLKGDLAFYSSGNNSNNVVIKQIMNKGLYILKIKTDDNIYTTKITKL